MCHPGPQRQPTVSTGSVGAPGLSIGMAWETPAAESRGPAASASGAICLTICLVNMTTFSMVTPDGHL